MAVTLTSPASIAQAAAARAASGASTANTAAPAPAPISANGQGLYRPAAAPAQGPTISYNQGPLTGQTVSNPGNLSAQQLQNNTLTSQPGGSAPVQQNSGGGTQGPVQGQGGALGGSLPGDTGFGTGASGGAPYQLSTGNNMGSPPTPLAGPTQQPGPAQAQQQNQQQSTGSQFAATNPYNYQDTNQIKQTQVNPLPSGYANADQYAAQDPHGYQNWVLSNQALAASQQMTKVNGSGNPPATPYDFTGQVGTTVSAAQNVLGLTMKQPTDLASMAQNPSFQNLGGSGNLLNQLEAMGMANIMGGYSAIQQNLAQRELITQQTYQASLARWSDIGAQSLDLSAQQSELSKQQIDLQAQESATKYQAKLSVMLDNNSRLEGFIKGQLAASGALDSSAGLTYLSTAMNAAQISINQVEQESQQAQQYYALQSRQTMLDYAKESFNIMSTVQTNIDQSRKEYNDQVNQIEASQITSLQNKNTQIVDLIGQAYNRQIAQQQYAADLYFKNLTASLAIATFNHTVTQDAVLAKQFGQTNALEIAKINQSAAQFGATYNLDLAKFNAEYGTPLDNGGGGGGNIPNAPVISGNIGGKTIQAQPVFMDALQQADAAMFAATGQHIQIGENYRTNQQQKDIRKRFGYTSDSQASGAGGLPMAAPPGTSFHEKGLAVDVTNWQAASPYLAKFGIVGGLKNDMNHFSMGEMNPGIFKSSQSSSGGSDSQLTAYAKQYLDGTMDIKVLPIGQQRQVAQEAARLQSDTGGNYIPAPTRKIIQDQSTKFNTEPIVSDFYTVKNSIAVADQISNSDVSGNDDTLLAFNFLKVLHPETARLNQSPQETITQNQTLLQPYMRAGASLTNPDAVFLSPESRQSMKATMQRAYDGYYSQFNNVLAGYTQSLSTNYNVPEDKVKSFFTLGNIPAPTQGPNKPGPTQQVNAYTIDGDGLTHYFIATPAQIKNPDPNMIILQSS